jgi:uncharacterized damage-inducible protein DinB
MRCSQTGNTMLQSVILEIARYSRALKKKLKKILAAARLSLDVRAVNAVGQTLLHTLCDPETFRRNMPGVRQTRAQQQEEQGEKRSESAEDEDEHEAHSSEQERKQAPPAAAAAPKPAEQGNLYNNRARKLTDAVLHIALRKGADLYQRDKEGQRVASG